VSWVGKLEQARAELDRRSAHPWTQKLERDLRGVQAISSIALLDLLGVPPTTGNARRLAAAMRSMGFIPLKSRRLVPGGFRDTTIRGWARPLGEDCRSTPSSSPDAVGCDPRVKKKEECYGLPETSSRHCTVRLGGDC